LYVLLDTEPTTKPTDRTSELIDELRDRVQSLEDQVASLIPYRPGQQINTVLSDKNAVPAGKFALSLGADPPDFETIISKSPAKKHRFLGLWALGRA
jgi:hypothetical protein